MKTLTTITYQCEVCQATYKAGDEARACEARPVQHDRGVKVGETVKITQGDGTGLLAKVESVTVLDKEYGHYAWERYWHTAALTAKLIDGSGHRFLTFDSYAVVP